MLQQGPCLVWPMKQHQHHRRIGLPLGESLAERCVAISGKNAIEFSSEHRNNDLGMGCHDRKENPISSHKRV